MSGLHDAVDEPASDRGGMLIREASIEDLVDELRSRVDVSAIMLLTKDSRRLNYSHGDGISTLGLVTWGGMCVRRRIRRQDESE